MKGAREAETDRGKGSGGWQRAGRPREPQVTGATDAPSGLGGTWGEMGAWSLCIIVGGQLGLCWLHGHAGPHEAEPWAELAASPQCLRC